ncbi:caspase domain-containing protein [Desarmillaria tabescens]|uniref:Caspase domain-containing protein n=1 Tax=Armillaria tabescens TaxID=1929756 RepID=A0AA39NB65_ARMTA|nr:caspase domain-containing protein [Desarmillaria tabescens]KAK0462334.1 caspase domain-containing protein [Desarmillaria tabescens]
MREDADYAEVHQKDYELTLDPTRILDQLNDDTQLRLDDNRIRDLLDDPIELEMHSLPPSPSHLVDASQFFAIIIGIDAYGSYPLRGCVSDALLMEKYLTEDLGVPGNHIQLLLGSGEHTSPDDQMNPSRANIINALTSLAANDEVKFGDIIIIYFAGHGSSYPPSEDGVTYGVIETLCPLDRDSLDAYGKPIPDISDREFNTILSRIAEAKGHRITVILDCCHHSGASRCLPEAGSRTLPPMLSVTLQDMLLAGENNLKYYPSYRSILAKDWYPDTESHVLLAACKDYQFAKEKKVNIDNGTRYNGIFTDALARALRSSNWNKEMTYTDLVRYLGKTSQQTPVAAGKRRGARIWYQE